MAGCSVTCGICGAVIETPGRDLVIGGELIAEGCVIDLDQNHRDFVAHYAECHPGAEVPPRLW